MKALVLLVFVACADAHTNQQVQFSNLTFELPDGWSEANGTASDSRMWVPNENTRLESIVMIRSNASTGVSPDAVSSLLEEAQDGIAPTRPQATTLTTAAGLQGTRVEFDYIPPGSREQYHRIHTVFLDGSSLIHVIYTAKGSEPQLTTLAGVIRSLHET